MRFFPLVISLLKYIVSFQQQQRRCPFPSSVLSLKFLTVAVFIVFSLITTAATSASAADGGSDLSSLSYQDLWWLDDHAPPPETTTAGGGRNSDVESTIVCLALFNSQNDPGCKDSNSAPSDLQNIRLGECSVSAIQGFFPFNFRVREVSTS